MAFLLVVGLIAVLPVVTSHALSIGEAILLPIQGSVYGIAGSIARATGTVQQAGTLAQQNNMEQEEIDRLQSQIIQMNEIQLENEDLRQMLGLQARSPIGSMLLANVVARDPLPIVQSLTIDRGSDDGAAPATPVVTWKGVVGRVVQATPKTSKVLLATDPNSAISARIQADDSRATGIVRGTGDGRLIMEYVSADDVLRVGDQAITSSGSQEFPPGLLLGTVIQVRHTDAEAFQEALIAPAVDMRDLERLYVLTPAAASTARPR